MNSNKNNIKIQYSSTPEKPVLYIQSYENQIQIHPTTEALLMLNQQQSVPFENQNHPTKTDLLPKLNQLQSVSFEDQTNPVRTKAKHQQLQSVPFENQNHPTKTDPLPKLNQLQSVSFEDQTNPVRTKAKQHQLQSVPYENPIAPLKTNPIPTVNQQKSLSSESQIHPVKTKAMSMLNQTTSMSLKNQFKSNPVQNYAIVVPCYNEEKRFPFNSFLHFAQKHPEVLLCFVNDGCKDKTLTVLRGIQYECPENICVYTLEKNAGKSEAVRQGMLYVHKHFKTELIGFLDADLATTPEEWLQMAKYKEQYPQFGAIVGSRIQRLGANINRHDSRSLFSSIVKKFIGLILKAKFHDTQCGAKIFESHLVPFLFSESFDTPWLFDVEIFLRLQKKFGKTTLQKGVLEYPLMHWTEVGDSRLKIKDTIRIPAQLTKMYYRYHIAS